MRDEHGVYDKPDAQLSEWENHYQNILNESEQVQSMRKFLIVRRLTKKVLPLHCPGAAVLPLVTTP